MRKAIFKNQRLRHATAFLAVSVMVLAVATSLGANARAADSKADDRLPVPPKAAQAAAEAKLQRYFTQNYHKLTAWTTDHFAVHLLKEYGHAKGHPAIRYVALNLAWKLAARGGNFIVTAQAVGDLRAAYQIDGYALHLQASRRLLPRLHSRALLDDLGDFTSHWGEEAITASDFRPAAGLLATAARCYGLSGNPAGVAKVRRLARHLAVLEPTSRQLTADQATLKKTPQDPAALIRTTLYYWLVAANPAAHAKGNQLAKASGSATLASITKLSKKPDATTAEKIHLGNLWWNLPKTHKLLAYTPLVQRHAIKIYRRAIPGVARAFSAMIGRGDYHAAVLFITQAKKAAKRTRDPKMLAIARPWNSMLRQARMLHRRYTAALKTITKKADDPVANQTIGEYLCFLGGQWRSGLAYLKLAGLPGLANAAKMDLADPTTPAAQIALGNKWWILAHGYRGITRTNIELRAVHWYALALKKLPASAYKDLRYRVAKLQAGSQ